MSSFKPSAAVSADWTGLLADPDLARNLGKLLQVYRDAPPEKRDEALLESMRQIKREASGSGVAASSGKTREATKDLKPTRANTTPPYEPDIFSPNWGQDRRQHPRIKCFVAVELQVSGADAPIWGHLSDTSLGGCQIETSSALSGGSKVEIGLWVASGKIWVKGFALNGVIKKSAGSGGVRVRFSGMDFGERENLREFLKYVQAATRVATSETRYLELLK